MAETNWENLGKYRSYANPLFLRPKYLLVALCHVPRSGFGSPLHGQEVPIREILHVRAFVEFRTRHAHRSKQTKLVVTKRSIFATMCSTCGRMFSCWRAILAK